MKKYTIKEARVLYRDFSAPTVVRGCFVKRVVKQCMTPSKAASQPYNKEELELLKMALSYDDRVDAASTKEDICPRWMFEERVFFGISPKEAISLTVDSLFDRVRDFYDRFEGIKAVSLDLFYRRVRKAVYNGSKHTWNQMLEQPALRNHNSEIQTSEVRRFYDLNKYRASVSLTTFKSRVRKLEWDYEKALTTPPFRDRVDDVKSFDYYRANINRANVKYAVFNKRVKKGWDIETALVSPLNTRNPGAGQSTESGEKTGTVTSQAKEFFISNEARAAVPYRTFIERVRARHWDHERALTTPLRVKKEFGAAKSLVNNNKKNEAVAGLSSWMHSIVRKSPVFEATSTVH